MCLTLQTLPQRIKRIALTNKKCYKVMCQLNNGSLRSPYIHHEYVLNRMETSMLNKRINSYYGHVVHEIWEGLHSFPDIQRAKEELYRHYIKYLDSKNVIVECIIPRGSIYYVGEFHIGQLDYLKSYASNKLTPIKIIK